jgi:transcriptional regulator with XRE-family HTH domain
MIRKTAAPPKPAKKTGRVPEPNAALIEARKAAGLNQEDVEKQIGVTQASLSNWEAGACPSLPYALQMARFYGRSVEELFGHLLSNLRKKRSAPVVRRSPSKRSGVHRVTPALAASKETGT